MKEDKKFTIGVLVGNANSPHTIDTIQGIAAAAAELGINVVNFLGVYSSYYFRDYFEKEDQEDYDYQSMSVYGYRELCNVDALIISYGTLEVFFSEKELKEFNRNISGIPTVYLESRLEGNNLRHVIADNYSGMKMTMEHLIDYHGYKNIVYLSGPEGNLDANERKRAYVDMMNEAGLKCDESTIEYGDFSEKVDDQVNALLDRNPDAEAIVCANDEMAITAYRVIRERERLFNEAVTTSDKEGMRRFKRHVIGSSSEMGIAVTGFDNSSDSGNVDPPLTTTAQSPYSHGYMAVKTIVALLDDSEKAESILAKPKFIKRQSCGCKVSRHLDFPELDERYKVQPELYAATAAEIYTNGLLPAELNSEYYNRVYDTIYEVILKNVKRYIGISEEKFSSDELLEDTKKFLNDEISRYIPRMTFVSTFNDFMLGLLRNAKDGPQKEVLFDAESKISDYVYSALFSESRESLNKYRHRTWFMPLISRDMANNLSSPKKMYYDAMSKIGVLNLGDSYLFLLNESIKHRRNEKWSCPKELYLVGYTDGNEIHSFDMKDAPVISAEKVLNDYVFCEDEAGVSASVFSLYSGEYQYGFLVSKVKPDDILSVYYASVQISTALKYCEMASVQKKTQSELQEIIREVEDKNEILRSLSEYDQLTGCYNRRGFLEKGLSLIRDNMGKKACIVYADLDHLKEINDKYGHTEGDYAIENTAKNIRTALPASSILARLGGDEFVAMFLMSDEMDAGELVNNISNTAVRFNAFSAKPYYVECSAGYSEFVCDEETRLEDIMSMADTFLYEAKRRRRQSIVKKITIV